MTLPSGFRKYLSNTAWMVGGRMIKLAMGFAATVVVARYLGPDRFGLLNYCYSLVIITMVLVVLGLETIVVRELVKLPGREAEILGTSVVLQYIGTLLAGGSLVAFVLLKGLDREATVLVAICAISLIFRPICILRSYFEAHVQARYIATVELIQSLTSVLLRLYFVYIEAPLTWFAFCLALEWIGMGIGFLLIYWRSNRGNPPLFSWSASRARLLFGESWPLLASAAAITLHQQIDKVMIKELMGADANAQIGFYSAAVHLCIFVTVIPQMIVASLTPALVAEFERRRGIYAERAGQFMDLMNWVGLGLSLLLFLIAKPVILLGYGAAYAPAVLVLQIAAWKGFFTATGMATGRLCTVEHLQRHLYWRNVIGLVVNVSMNWVLIPKYGAVGAACATVVSMCAANVLSHVIIRPYRHIFRNQVVSLLIGWYRLPVFLVRALQRKKDWGPGAP